MPQIDVQSPPFAPITDYANAYGSKAFLCQCEDENGNPVTPLTFRWTLSDDQGNVINGRQDVSASPASPVVVVLSGDDLGLLPFDDYVRVLNMFWTYDSTYGPNMSGAGVYLFGIQPGAAT